MEEYSKELPTEKIIDIRAGYNNYAVLTENHKIYIQGYCNGYHLEDGNTKTTLWHKERPNELEEKVSEWDVGYDFHVYVTDNGKCYAAGNEFLRGIDLENNSKEYKEITFEEGYVPVKPFCSNYYESPRCCIMMLKKDDRYELWSCGYSSYGLLGQGDGKNESKKFAPMNYDKEKLNFVQMSMYSNFAHAVTDKGELYAWGNNGYKQMGTTDYNNKYSPTEVPFFKDYYTHQVKAGQNMILVWASPRNNMEVKQLFVMGDVKGVNTEGITNEGILHLKDMDNCEFKWMEAFEECCYMGFKGENSPNENVSVHEGYT